MRLRPSGRPLPMTLIALVSGILIALVAAGLTAFGNPAVRANPTAHAAPAPAKVFTLPRLGGGLDVALAGDAGQPVIINFFASWCFPCRKETPLLAGFYRSHHGRVLVIGVDANDKSAAALRFVHAHGVQYPVGFDPTASVTLSYGVVALPQTFFLNARHQIVRHVIGALTQRELDSWAASLPHPNGAS